MVMKLFVFTVFSVIFISCDSFKDGGTIGPCVHIYEEPILHIESVTSTQSGQIVPAFQILEAKLNGQKQDPFMLKIQSYNVAAYDTILVCNSPCGFAVLDGTYSLLVRAQGYRDTTISVMASYSVNKGGCPSSSSGGVRFSFQMQPQ